MAKTRFPKVVAESVLHRASGICEALIGSGCEGSGQHIHHRKLRSRGGEDTAENCVSICHVCHDWIHANVAESTKLGWIVQSWADPAHQPVRIQGAWLRLSDVYTACTDRRP